MKCRICASECPPGANLCRDCAAARERAFAATVTQPLLAAAGAPSVGRPRFAPRPKQRRPERKPATATAARSEAVIAASAAEDTPAPRKPIGVQWLLLALAVACAILYLLIQVLMTHHGPANDAATPSDAVSEGAPASKSDAAPPPVTVPPFDGVVEPPPGAASAEAKAAAASALKNAAAKAGRHKVAKVEPVNPVAVAPPAPAPEPAPVARAPAPPVVEAPRDPWQAMNEGLSRCARQDWLSRGSCEQRLRMQYCPEHWGLVWQCPIGPATDHGQ